MMGVDLPGTSQFTTSMHMFGKGPASDDEDEEDEYEQSPYKEDYPNKQQEDFNQHNYPL